MPVPIYLDNAATTTPLEAVVEAVAETAARSYGNPSSHHELGRQARRRLEDAREFLRGTVSAAQVVFTSGGTEADMLGVVGAALARPPGRVLAGAADHPAVLAQARLLERSGHRLTTIGVTATGDVEPEALFEALGADVRVVALLHGHNELGTLLRVAELASIVRRVSPQAHLHVDFVQGYGKVPFDLDALDVDSVAISGHKLHGPRGIGFLAISSKARVAPVLEGGGQEGGLRSGTENLPGAVGLMVAAQAALTHSAALAAHCAELGELLQHSLRARFPGLERFGHPQRRLPHVFLLRIPGVVAQALQERCSDRGVLFSTGSACHDEKGRGSHVHEAIGLQGPVSRELFRISLSRRTTLAEIDQAAAVIGDEAGALLQLAPRRSAGGGAARR
jgi:cysteine desulfurase